MAKEKTNQSDPNWQYYHASASHTTQRLHVYSWTCPDCKTLNKTKVNPSDPGRKFRDYRGLSARCGHCHGNQRRLTDQRGWTFDPWSESHA